jgi:hypothetical protein
MNTTVFWDVTPCSPAEVHQLCAGTYCLHLQDRMSSYNYNYNCFPIESFLGSHRAHSACC